MGMATNGALPAPAFGSGWSGVGSGGGGGGAGGGAFGKRPLSARHEAYAVKRSDANALPSSA